ncbi:MAG TPA: hypothetical protein VHS59_01350 [Bacillota bacterium]|nr:hypothetical protein [Bacillota bacterium]
MLAIFTDELAAKKIRKSEKLFAEFIKEKTETNTKLEIVKAFLHN